jgi:hypothetical protein
MLKTLIALSLIPLFTACGNNVKTQTGQQLAEDTQLFNVSATNAPKSYTINTFENPKITMHRGQTYRFTVNSLNHPFYIFFAPGNNPNNQYSNGVSGNGVQVGSLIITVPSTAPSLLYYGSSSDADMTGVITVNN